MIWYPRLTKDLSRDEYDGELEGVGREVCALDLDLTRVRGEELGSRVVQERLVSEDGADIDVEVRKWGGVLESETCGR